MSEYYWAGDRLRWLSRPCYDPSTSDTHRHASCLIRCPYGAGSGSWWWVCLLCLCVVRDRAGVAESIRTMRYCNLGAQKRLH